MIAIIGDEGIDPTGMMYETQLTARGHEVQWISFEELARTIVANVGETLCDWLEHDPYLTQLPASAFSLDSNAPIRGVSGAIVVEVKPRFMPCRYLIARVFRGAGIVQPNLMEGVRMSSDKWATHERLVDWGLPRPRALLVRSEYEALQASEQLLFPLVIKERASTQGIGVHRARSRDELLECIAALQLGSHALLVEQYVECSSTDKRIIVIGDSVLGGMERVAKEGDFRANLALGGSIGEIGVQPDEAELALSASRALEMSFTGMDLGRVTAVLPGREHLPLGTLFCVEANGSAGLSGFKQATGIDASGPVIDMMLRIIDEKAARTTTH